MRRRRSCMAQTAFDDAEDEDAKAAAAAMAATAVEAVLTGISAPSGDRALGVSDRFDCLPVGPATSQVSVTFGDGTTAGTRHRPVGRQG